VKIGAWNGRQVFRWAIYPQHAKVEKELEYLSVVQGSIDLVKVHLRSLSDGIPNALSKWIEVN